MVPIRGSPLSWAYAVNSSGARPNGTRPSAKGAKNSQCLHGRRDQLGHLAQQPDQDVKSLPRSSSSTWSSAARVSVPTSSTRLTVSTECDQGSSPSGFPSDCRSSTATNPSPSCCLRNANRCAGTNGSPSNRRPSTHSPSRSQRRATTSRSAGEQSIVRRRLLVTAEGKLGCASTGASTRGSTAIANPKPPLKHRPTTPTPGPPQHWCSAAASLPQPAHHRRGATSGEY